jgi:hypothetical protein
VRELKLEDDAKNFLMSMNEPDLSRVVAGLAGLRQDAPAGDKELLDESGNEEYWTPAIETNLSGEERAQLDECRRKFREHPERFTPWEDFLKELSTAKGKNYF